ncbi:MAG: DNA alkylation repair protein [Planctomycetota bacterium]
MTTRSLLRELRTRLAQLRVVDTPTLRTLRRGYSTRLQHASAAQVIELALALAEGTEAEYLFVAAELINSHAGARAALRPQDLAPFLRALSSWGAVDMVGCILTGPAWREHQLPESLLEKWTRSANRWLRRLALVSTVPLNSKARGGRGDAPRTLRVCEALLDDRDDMVVKALSWALRELAKRDPAVVKKFLARHRERLPARVRRETEKKITTGRKV